MEEIKIEIPKKSKSYRKDEVWSDQHEELAEKWKNDAQKGSEDHLKFAKKHKCRHITFGVPSVILPFVFTTVCVLLENDPSLPYVSAGGFILCTIFSAVDKFFNFAGKKERHKNHSDRYADIVRDIEFELKQGRKYRVDPDEYLKHIEGKLDSVSGSAPDLF